MCLFVFFFKQKTAYEMRISDWSSDVCSSDLPLVRFCPVVYGCRCIRITERYGLCYQGIRSCRLHLKPPLPLPVTGRTDRKSVVSGKSVSVRVDLGGRRIIKKKNNS